MDTVNELKALMKATGISQKVVAEQYLELNDSYLSQILGGHRAPSSKVLKRMAKLIATIKESGLVAV